MCSNEYLIYLHRLCDHDSMDEDEMTAFEFLEEKITKSAQVIDTELVGFCLTEPFSPNREYKHGSLEDKFVYMMALVRIIYSDGYRYRTSGRVPDFVDKDRLIRFQNNYRKVNDWLKDCIQDYHERSVGFLENASEVLTHGKELKYAEEPKQRKYQSASPIDIFGGI